MKATVEVATRRIATGTIEETIEDAFTATYDEEKEGIKTPIRITVEGALTNIVEQDRQDTIFVPNIHKLAELTRYIDDLSRQGVGRSPLLCQARCLLKSMLKEQ